MIEFKEMKAEYTEEAVGLAMDEYRTEQRKCSHLPERNFEKELEDIITEACRYRYKKAAFEKGRLIGYMGFGGPWEDFFGKVKGVYSPLGGSAFAGNRRNILASRMFQELGEELAADGICSYALTRYAHDEEVGRSFILNGFGIRCSDAVRRLSGENIVPHVQERMNITELKKEERRNIDGLRKGLIKHLSKAPAFCPSDLSNFDKWTENNEIRIFGAKDGDICRGYMAIRHDGENFVSNGGYIYNICGAYVDETCRSRGLAAQLLEYLCKTVKEEGYEYLGVDCETINPTALWFWNKYFEPYTYSYARRIDERAVGYGDYFKSMME